jgi:monoamine oxidase
LPSTNRSSPCASCRGRRSSANNPDVVVIGAGAAGLAAARELSGAGRRVVILEARERIGGRIFTIHQPDLALPIELGAEFIHGEVEETFSIVDAAALLVYRLPDDHWWSRGGEWERVENFWKTMRGVFARIRPGRDRSFVEFLRAQRGLSARTKEMALGFVEGFNAAHADRISALALREEGDSEEFKQFRIANGYDAVIAWLRAGLDPQRVTTRLATAVTEVAWRGGAVTVRTSRGESLHASAAVITIPAGVLKTPDAIRFTPSLRDHERALERIEVGHVVKVILRFRERFWDDFDFVHSDDAHFPTWWTAAPVRAPLLTGWAGGHAADRLLAEGGDAIIERGMASLAAVLRVPRKRVAAQLDAAYGHDWQSDEFSRGAYSYAGVGGSHAYRALAKPVKNTLFFAGEATSDQTGTVAGAIASGRRAAREILRRR